MRGIARWIWLKRVEPSTSSRTIRSVHFSPSTSAVLEMGQNWLYSITAGLPKLLLKVTTEIVVVYSASRSRPPGALPLLWRSSAGLPRRNRQGAGHEHEHEQHDSHTGAAASAGRPGLQRHQGEAEGRLDGRRLRQIRHLHGARRARDPR